MDIYRYRPLSSPNATRLFELNAFGRQLQGSLIEVDLENPPKYDAISYVWGNPTLDRAILCNGKVINVTSSCEAVLRRVRNFLLPKLIWIDVICIDQSSRAERSQQVGIMHKIYSRAQNTLIWLGEGTEQSDRAIGLLEDLALVPFLPKSIGQEISDLQLGRGRGTGFPVKDKDAVKEAFADLFGRAWFWRTWTVQEVALASDAYLLCGEKSLSWELMGVAMTLWVERHERNPYMLAPKQYMSIMRVHWEASRDIKIFRNEKSSIKLNIYDRKPTLKTLLQDTHFMKVTDPRDKVFALHGLASVLGLRTVQPNYDESVSVADVYTLATNIAMLEEEEHPLSILYRVGPSNVSGLPSWVPDWSRTYKVAVTHSDEFSAAGDSKPCSALALNGQTLRCAGVAVDRVAGYSTAVFEEGLEDFITTMQKWTELGRNLADYPNGESVDLAFCKTLIHDQYEAEIHLDNLCHRVIASLGPAAASLFGESELRKPAIHYYSAYKTWHASIMETADPPVECIPCQRSKDFKATPSPNEGDHLKSSQLPKVPQADLEAYVRAVIKTTRNMCFFITEAGHMGTTYRDILSPEADNIIILIAGLKVPFIVRPMAAERLSYRLLGPAYVQGMMWGEAWPKSEYDTEADTEPDWDRENSESSAEEEGSFAASSTRGEENAEKHGQVPQDVSEPKEDGECRREIETPDLNYKSTRESKDFPPRSLLNDLGLIDSDDESQSCSGHEREPSDNSEDWETIGSDPETSVNSNDEFFWLGNQSDEGFDLSDPVNGLLAESERWEFETSMMGKNRMFRFT